MAGLMESVEKAFVKLRRKRVSRRLFERHRGIVQAGLFKGLALDGDSNISQGPLAVKVFGLYEKVVFDKIVALGPFGDIVNLGAADGYFSLGLLKAGMGERSICFEITESGRAAVRRNAQRNQLSDRVEVLGAADAQLGARLAEVGFRVARSLVLCDIEGGEFTVLTRDVLQALCGATLIIELHDRIHSGKPDRRDALIANLPAGCRYEIIRTTPPDWAGIADIEALSDNDRALVVSEGRRAIGEWLVVTGPGHQPAGDGGPAADEVARTSAA